ncbi:ribosomal RNA small subunit methyltransferase A [Patescibacteria group bacterium]
MSERIQNILARTGIEPNLRLGQHFLIDYYSLRVLANSASSNASVIEIGAGTGELTRLLAERSKGVVAVEIDRRYRPFLENVRQNHPNVDFIFGNALEIGVQQLISLARSKMGICRVKLVSNPPYHIVEPLILQCIGLPIDEVTMTVTKKFAREVESSKRGGRALGRFGLLTQTFFNFTVLQELGRNSFYPPPRIDSAIVKLTPRNEKDFYGDSRLFLLQRLFLSSATGITVGRCLKDGWASYQLLTGQNRQPKTLDLNERILRKIFRKLNNYELCMLYQSLG